MSTKYKLIAAKTPEEAVEKLAKALELEPGEQVRLVVPQFERPDGKVVTYMPKSKEEFDALPSYTDEVLLGFGLQVWDVAGGVATWLYPGEWYSLIPAGYTLVDIFGSEQEFESGKTSDDIRYGCLAYGFCKTVDPFSPLREASRSWKAGKA